MDILFVGAKVKNLTLNESAISEINQIPEKNIAICYSNQFVDIAKEIIERTNKKITSVSQVLGCSNPAFSKETQAILIIGQGKFHPVSLAYESKLPTYVLEDNTLRKITSEEISKMEKRERGALLKYLNSENIGILITNKPGQMRLKRAIEFKKSLKNKKGYLFIDNNLDINQFENFGIDFWVNTACPRMDLTNGPLINLDKIPKELIK